MAIVKLDVRCHLEVGEKNACSFFVVSAVLVNCLLEVCPQRQ